MAKSSEEERTARRRRRLTRGLILGTAALGLPALYNALRARRAEKAEPLVWGEPDLVSTRAGRVAVRRFPLEGAPELVLLHSLAPGHSSAHWRAVAEVLASRFSVTVLDWPGWGDSERLRQRYTPELLSDSLEDLLSAERPATLVAAGLAAIPAVLRAAARPNAVDGLVLSCPRGALLAPRSGRDRVLGSLVRLPVLGTSAVHLATSRENLHEQIVRSFARPERVPAEMLDHYDRLAHLPGSQWPLGSYLSGSLEIDVRETWSQLQQPTLLVWGRRAVLPELPMADLWLNQRPARLVVLDEAGSLPHVECPEAFSQQLASWFDSDPDAT